VFLLLFVHVVFQKKLQLISFSTVTDMLLFGILCSPLLSASLLGEAWSGAGKGTRLKWLLCGIGNVSIDTNINLFLSVQKFIIDSGRFTRSSP
jgi:hypothetical protein